MINILFCIVSVIYISSVVLFSIYISNHSVSDFEMYMKHTGLDKYVDKNKSDL